MRACVCVCVCMRACVSVPSVLSGQPVAGAIGRGRERGRFRRRLEIFHFEENNAIKKPDIVTNHDHSLVTAAVKINYSICVATFYAAPYTGCRVQQFVAVVTRWEHIMGGYHYEVEGTVS